MPWFKVDDSLHSHPKPRKVSLAALGLWSMCGSWSMAYKQDGFVPEWFVTSFPSGKRLAGELVDAGLWSSATKGEEKGWKFHDWTDYQPSSEEIEAEREAARERQRAFRAKRREGRNDGRQTASVTPLVTRDSGRDFDVTNSTPSRPVPSLPGPPCIRKTRVAGFTTSSSYVTREPSDAMVKALTRPEVIAA